MNILEYKELYRDNLLNDVIPFWMEHSLDAECGGYYSCLDRGGDVYDTDKFIWMQCRQVWMFSVLYNRVEQRRQWLDMATGGAEFLKDHGRDPEGNWYFALNREGEPLVQPYNIFSDCFAAMAFDQLYKATGELVCKDIAEQTFQHILQRRDNPKGQYEKTYPGTRPSKSMALPMIISNLVLEIEHLLEPGLVDEITSYCKDEVLDVFYKPEEGVLVEQVNADGSFQDSFDGRQVMPGHSLEAMGFMMDLARREDDKELLGKSVDIAISLLEYGWDREYEGIFYMMDIKGYPPDQLEWDQKLWWVHQEAILTVLKGYLLTGDQRCRDWFERLHQYSWTHFPDEKHGGWFGYLNRRGEVLLPLKGGKWKGCFHTPRFLLQSWKIFEELGKEQDGPKGTIPRS